MAKKNDDLFLVGVEFLGKWLFKFTKFSFKYIGKALIVIFKATIKEMKQIKLILKSNFERYMLLVCTLITTFIIVYYIDVKYSLVSVLSYFIIKAAVKEIKSYMKRMMTNIKISTLSKKYKELCEVFNNKIKVTEKTRYKIVLFSREVTLSEIKAKMERIEMFFSMDISYIARRKNYKYYDVVFHVKTNFKKYYKFQEYLNYIKLKVIKNMYLPMILGLDESGNMLIKDLADIKHLFINGQSGGGKSSIINCIIQSLMVLTDDTVYILIDLKGGAEMSDYKDFKNIILVYTIEDLDRVIKALEKIMEYRLALIRNTKRCRDIQAYNSKKGVKKLNNIVFVIDEIASIRLSGYEDYKILEKSLLQILQKGRVTGIHGIGATQKPSGEQINTNLREGYLENISFKVKDKITQRQTKVLGTEKLKTGEFKSTMTEDEIFKGFLIRDTEDKKKGLPECNEVFENLEHKQVYENDFIEIKEKPIKKETRLLQKLLRKLNKGNPTELSSKIDYRQLIKSVSESVNSDIEEIKKLSGIKDFSIGNEVSLHTDNYFKFLCFIYENCNESGKLPATKIIHEKLGIQKPERIDLLTKAHEEELLIKKNERVYLINFDNQRWKSIINVA